MKLRYFQLAAVIVLIAACSTARSPLEDYELQKPVTIMDAPAPSVNAAASADPNRVERGRYLVELLGCGSCHTDGALIGEPNMDRRLAGSHVGIAYSDPLKHARPGIVYPANLTPDPKTGIGGWNDEQIIRVIRSGVDRAGRQHLSVMPWPAYGKLSDEDALAIAAYLRSLPPVEHLVPENVRPGAPAKAPYVHIGVYRSRQ